MMLSVPAWAAAPPDRGPTVTLDQTSVQPGQRVLVTLTGWSARNVTLSVCGNLARRGSADCNVAASQAESLVNAPAPTLVKLTVFAPPGTCPCVIRVASAASDEVVVAPIELVGVPVGPVVGPVVDAPLDQAVTIRAERVGFIGALRGALGGPATYDVKVSLRNVTAETLTGISVAGSVGRSRTSTARSFDFPSPGEIGPGQTWRHSYRVTVPPPVITRLFWHVTVSGVGAPGDTDAVTHRAPLGFVVLTAILVVDLVGMAWYFGARRLRRERPDERVEADLLPAMTSVPAA